MDAQRQKKVTKAQVTGTYNLIPPSTGQNKRKLIAARFPQGPPGFAQEVCVLQFEGQPPNKQQKAEQQKEPSLLLSRRQQQGQALVGPKQLQGVPRPDAASNYFVLSKGPGCGKGEFQVQPLDATFTFKQYTRTTALSIDEVEAQMRSAAGGGAEPARLLPKSMRKQMQESAAAAAAEKQLQEDVAPLFDKAKVAELSVKYGGTTTQGKLVQGHSDDEEGSEDGWGLTGEGADGSARKKGPAKDKKGAAKGAGKGKKGGKDDGDNEIPEDEVPEDIFAGEEDELRPEAPLEDADWEYKEDAADDDLYQGASEEEEQPDDPGMRKKLGLEEEEEEEEEKKEPEEDKPEGEAAAAAGAAGAAAAGPSQASQGGSVESESVADDEEIDENVDLDRLAAEHDMSQQPAKRRKGSVGPPGRDRSPAPSRLATPPLGSTAASAGGSRATPPLAGNRRGSTPPLGSKAAAAAGGSKKTPPPGAAPRRTPPPGSTAPKRKREDAAATGAAAAAAGAAAAAAGAAAGSGGLVAYMWRPEQLDAQGVPTVEGVRQALQQMGPLPVTQLSLLNVHLDAVRVGDEGKKLLKARILQVAKVEVSNGVKVVILKGS